MEGWSKFAPLHSKQPWMRPSARPTGVFRDTGWAARATRSTVSILGRMVRRCWPDTQTGWEPRPRTALVVQLWLHRHHRHGRRLPPPGCSPQSTSYRRGVHHLTWQRASQNVRMPRRVGWPQHWIRASPAAKVDQVSMSFHSAQCHQAAFTVRSPTRCGTTQGTGPRILQQLIRSCALSRLAAYRRDPANLRRLPPPGCSPMSMSYRARHLTRQRACMNVSLPIGVRWSRHCLPNRAARARVGYRTCTCTIGHQAAFTV